jgi:hypothetical protein
MDLDGNPAIFIGFDDGVFMVDLTNDQLVPRLDLSADVDPANCVGMVVHEGKLIVLTKRRGIIAYNYDGTYEHIGLNLRQDLPSDKRGEHVDLVQVPDYLVQTLQAEKSCAFVLHRGGWHYLTQGAVASQIMKPIALSSEDDGTHRLHWIAGTLPYFIEHPFENPLQITGATYATEGYLEPPKQDFGLPEAKMGIFSEFLEAENVGTNQYIEALYGIDNATPTALLGTATAGNTDLLFGDGVGTEGYIYQPRFRFVRGVSSGTTPVLRTPVLKFSKEPEKRDIFELVVDAKATARARRTVSPEAVIAEIGSLVSKHVQSYFQYGMMATRLVKVYQAPGEETWQDSDYQSERFGEVTLQLLEMLPH